MDALEHAIELAITRRAVHLFYDATGIGEWAEPLLERQPNLPFRFHPVHNRSRPTGPDVPYLGVRTNAETFHNRGSQQAWAIREALTTGRLRINSAIPNNLISELARPIYEYMPSGKIKIIKAPSGLASPNRFDAVRLAWGADSLNGLVLHSPTTSPASFFKGLSTLIRERVA